MLKWHLIGSTAFILVTAVLLAVLATFLPDNAYQRFQLLGGTIHQNVRWAYERMHFDPRPIDVAIVGDSRAAYGMRASLIEERLAQAGKPGQVVNMGLLGDGRNTEWLLIHELLKVKSPKVIIVAVNDRHHPWGHESFRYLAPAAYIWREVPLGLYDARKNLAYLPFRQLKLFSASLFPDLFSLPTRFDAEIYANTAYDRTIEPAPEMSREALLKLVRDAKPERHSRLPKAIRTVTDADDLVYVDLIAAEAAKRHIKLLFVYQPTFMRHTTIEDLKHYRSLGPVEDLSDISTRAELYRDPSHMNPAGSVVVSDRVAAALTVLLPPSDAVARPTLPALRKR
jgi:hypothetical protein